MDIPDKVFSRMFYAVFSTQFLFFLIKLSENVCKNKMRWAWLIKGNAIHYIVDMREDQIV